MVDGYGNIRQVIAVDLHVSAFEDVAKANLS